MRHARRIVLFLAAIAVPCLVLVALGLRIVRQDRELAQKRAAEEQLRLASQIRQAALNKLERVRLLVSAGQDSPGAVLVTAVRDRQMVPPWQTGMTASPADPEIEQGEHAEFAANQPAQAAEYYRRSLAASKYPAHSAFAQLLLARALHKAGKTAEARAKWHSLLNYSLEMTDEHGLPFALYAADRLKILPSDVMGHLSRLSPTALYLLKNLTGDPRVAERIVWAERVEALAAEFPVLVARHALDETWAPFGDPVWLVGMTHALKGGTALLLAVPAAEVLPPIDAGGTELGAEFPGVKVHLPQAALPTRDSSQSFLYIALSLVMAVTLFGAYLLWLDIRREVAVAQLRSQFVSSISHELKTPLTAIRMFAETLRLRGSSDRGMQEEYLDTIVNESERLSRLVDNVLEFSKIERDRKTYRFEPVSLNEVVASAARAMQYPLAQSGFHLALDIGGEFVPVRADKDALEQAVLNLLTNAMKYSGDAREIGVRLHRENGHAVIRVEDHGMGILPEQRKRIFEQFYRVQTPENQLIPGAGLGLTVVEHIARAHGGEVAVESKPGQGSAFSIRIPMEASS